MSAKGTKTLLMIAPAFYEYGARIQEEFEAAGYSVQRHDMLPTTLRRGLDRLLRRAPRVSIERHYRSILASAGSRRFDLVFMIKVDSIPESVLTALKALNPAARFVLYQWDSVRRCSFLPIVRYFDRTLSFDRIDCESHGFDYLPLFYCRDYEPDKNARKLYDVCFIGGYHESRDRIVSDLLRQADRQRLSVFVHMYVPLLQYLFLVLVKKKRILTRVSFLPMSLRRSAQAVRQSRAVIDVEHDGQNGLSLRTIEALTAGAKLLTTNRNVAKEAFYSEETITVLNRERPDLSAAFVAGTHTPPDMSAFRLQRWVAVIARP